MSAPPDASRRPAHRGTGQQITGRLTLNLMLPTHSEVMAEAGQVECLPAGTLVILRVAGTAPDPAVVDRLRTFGQHVHYEVHGRTGASTGTWVRALRDGIGWSG
jgi:hypothetical protein